MFFATRRAVFRMKIVRRRRACIQVRVGEPFLCTGDHITFFPGSEVEDLVQQPIRGVGDQQQQLIPRIHQQRVRVLRERGRGLGSQELAGRLEFHPSG